MQTLLSLTLLVALVVHVGAHVAITVGLARRREWLLAGMAFFITPLAPLWGWRAGMRLPVYAWSGGLLLYALAVTVA